MNVYSMTSTVEETKALVEKCSTHYPMAALSDKDPTVKYSWEDIKFTIGFEDRNKQPIDAETKRFKFIYKDEAGCCCEVSYDGKTRKNCVYRDGVLYGIFNSGTFRYGLLTVERHYWIEDADFDDGKWDYGDVYKTNIIIK